MKSCGGIKNPGKSIEPGMDSHPEPCPHTPVLMTSPYSPNALIERMERCVCMTGRYPQDILGLPRPEGRGNSAKDVEGPWYFDLRCRSAVIPANLHRPRFVPLAGIGNPCPYNPAVASRNTRHSVFRMARSASMERSGCRPLIQIRTNKILIRPPILLEYGREMRPYNPSRLGSGARLLIIHFECRGVTLPPEKPFIFGHISRVAAPYRAGAPTTMMDGFLDWLDRLWTGSKSNRSTGFSKNIKEKMGCWTGWTGFFQPSHMRAHARARARHGRDWKTPVQPVQSQRNQCSNRSTCGPPPRKSKSAVTGNQWVRWS